MTARLSVVLVGLDTRDGQRWTWRWSDEPAWHSPVRVDAAASRRVARLLAEAIPGRAAATSGGPPDLGPLASPETEWRFARDLAQAILPAELATEVVVRRARTGVPAEFRVLPSAATAAVPWELLPVGRSLTPDLRLLDVADVVAVAPLPGSPDPARRWSAVAHLPPLHVIDPDLTADGIPRVLDEPARQAWAGAHAAQDSPRRRGPRSLFGQRTNRRWLSRELVGRSRLFFLGHVVASTDDPAHTGMLLGCRPSDYPADRRTPPPRVRPFTARDASRGTLGAADLVADADLCRAVLGVASPTAENLPTAAWDAAAGQIVELPGRVLWPMPPRVAIVGCRSGGDTADAEPFGLVTAFLSAGAELVTATRWTVYTGRTFGDWGCDDDPLDAAAHVIDRAHEGDDPVAVLAGWQRTQLEAWRHGGPLRHTPLVWASIVTYVTFPGSAA